jgi:hypothetical protein
MLDDWRYEFWATKKKLTTLGYNDVPPPQAEHDIVLPGITEVFEVLKLMIDCDAKAIIVYVRQRPKRR